MTRKCQYCGKIYSDELYFCDGCGKAPSFPGAKGAQNGGASYNEAGNPSQGRDIIYYPVYQDPPSYYSSADSYGPSYGGPSAQRMPVSIWRAVFAVVGIIVLLSLSVLVYLWVQTPTINASAPSGWVEANELQVEEEEEELKAYFDDVELDYCFVHDISIAYEYIYIYHLDVDNEDAFPETTESGEMQRYIYELKGVSEDFEYGMERYIAEKVGENMQPMHLGCGQVGLYAIYNPDVIGVMERIVLRKGNRLFFIDVIQGYSDKYPSEEIEHLTETITID